MFGVAGRFACGYDLAESGAELPRWVGGGYDGGKAAVEPPHSKAEI